MKRNVFLQSLLLITAVLLLANLILHFSPERLSYADEVKVYKVVPLSKITNLEKGINEYAGEGWTLLEVDGDTGNLILFK